MSDTADNRSLVAAAFARWEQGEFDAVTSLMADDLEWTIIGSTDISGTYHTRDAFLSMVNERLFPHFNGPLQVTVHNVLADGAMVAVQFQSRAATRQGPDYEQVYCWVLELDAGRIRRGTAYLDTAVVERLLQ